jgi:hypothetical protein
MIAVVTSSLRPPAGGRRSACRGPVAIWPLIVRTMQTVTPKSLGRKPQRHPPAGGNRQSTTLSNACHFTPARSPAIKSP